MDDSDDIARLRTASAQIAQFLKGDTTQERLEKLQQWMDIDNGETPILSFVAVLGHAITLAEDMQTTIATQAERIAELEAALQASLEHNVDLESELKQYEGRIAELEEDNAKLREACEAFVEAWDLCKRNVYIRRAVPSNHQHALARAGRLAKAALDKDEEGG